MARSRHQTRSKRFGRRKGGSRKSSSATTRVERQFFIPSDLELESTVGKLPVFEPCDSANLLAEARTKRGMRHTPLDAAIDQIRNERKAAQLSELLAALGIDPAEKSAGWKAFVRLAELHHHVGRIVYRPKKHSPNGKWTENDESDLLHWVKELMNCSEPCGEREAVNIIADAIADKNVFPYDPQKGGPVGPLKGNPLKRARRNALWRKYQRIKGARRGSNESTWVSLVSLCGGFESAFELNLFYLERPDSAQLLAGDNCRPDNAPLCKSPGE